MAAEDPFDRFFYVWIALVVAAQRRRTSTGIPFREIYSDREKVLDYFRANQRTVKEVLHLNRDTMKKLVSRQGSRYKKPILDTRSVRLRTMFSDLAGYFTTEIPLPDEYVVESFGELINKIRINLFHGFDLYDDKEDCALLELVNPLLVQVLQACEPL